MAQPCREDRYHSKLMLPLRLTGVVLLCLMAVFLRSEITRGGTRERPALDPDRSDHFDLSHQPAPIIPAVELVAQDELPGDDGQLSGVVCVAVLNPAAGTAVTASSKAAQGRLDRRPVAPVAGEPRMERRNAQRMQHHLTQGFTARIGSDVDPKLAVPVPAVRERQLDDRQTVSTDHPPVFEQGSAMAEPEGAGLVSPQVLTPVVKEAMEDSPSFALEQNDVAPQQTRSLRKNRPDARYPRVQRADRSGRASPQDSTEIDSKKQSAEMQALNSFIDARPQSGVAEPKVQPRISEHPSPSPAKRSGALPKRTLPARPIVPPSRQSVSASPEQAEEERSTPAQLNFESRKPRADRKPDAPFTKVLDRATLGSKPSIDPRDRFLRSNSRNRKDSTNSSTGVTRFVAKFVGPPAPPSRQSSDARSANRSMHRQARGQRLKTTSAVKRNAPAANRHGRPPVVQSAKQVSFVRQANSVDIQTEELAQPLESSRPDAPHAFDAPQDDFKSIADIEATMEGDGGQQPSDPAEKRFQEAGMMMQPMGASRTGIESLVLWEAPAMSHRPLYFEDVNLERHGHTIGLFQPVLSAAHFFGRVPALPYLMANQGSRQCQYTLGHYRPGSCAPYQLYLPPLTLKGLSAEATGILGMLYLFP